MADQELNNAIADATRELTAKVAAQNGEAPETTEETNTESSEETSETTEETTEETTNEEELDDAAKDEAHRLYKALRDPKAAGPIIAALAQQAGILNPNKPAENKTEQTKQVKAVKELLKEGLGAEYEFLADRLGSSIEKILEQERSTQAEAVENLQKANTLREINTALEKLNRETKGESKKLETRMTALMDDFKPSGNVTIEQYLRRMYTLASAEKAGKNGKSNTQSNENRIRQNAADAPGRLKAGSAVHETALPEKKMSLKDSINWGIKQLEKGNK